MMPPARAFQRCPRRPRLDATSLLVVRTAFSRLLLGFPFLLIQVILYFWALLYVHHITTEEEVS